MELVPFRGVERNGTSCILRNPHQSETGRGWLLREFSEPQLLGALAVSTGHADRNHVVTGVEIDLRLLPQPATAQDGNGSWHRFCPEIVWSPALKLICGCSRSPRPNKTETVPGTVSVPDTQRVGENALFLLEVPLFYFQVDFNRHLETESSGSWSFREARYQAGAW